PDLDISDEGIAATLSFSRVPFATFVPWAAVYLIADFDGNGAIWQEDIPADLKLAGQSDDEAAPPPPPAPRASFSSSPSLSSSPSPSPSPPALPARAESSPDAPPPDDKPPEPPSGKKPRPSHLKLVK